MADGADDRDRIGRVVGNYELVERVGEGGMGTVWRAIDVMLDREVAIKAIRPDLAAEPQIVDRFRSEAKILARVHHPAIATIYSFFRDGGELYLAMEFVRGRTLSQVLREEGPLPWPRAVTLVAAALSGVEQVHRTGIIHRDLKPDNLMLTAAGELKVMDFGIARAVGADHLTRTGLVVGTLRYISPEQLRGEEVDHRADLYALGIVLYEMLTGRGPFRAGTEYETLRAQVEEAPIPPSTLVPGLPPWLDQAVLRALAKFPAQRFESAAAMAESLTAYRSAPADPATAPLPLRPAAPPTTPIAALPSNLPPPVTAASSYRAIGLGRSRGLLLGIAGAVVLLLAVAGVTWTLRDRPEPPSSTAPVAQPTSPVAMPAPAPQPPPATAVAPPAPATPASQPTETVAALPTTNPSLPPPRPTPPVRRSPVPTSVPVEVPPAAEPQETPPATPAAPSHEEPLEIPAGTAGPETSSLKDLSQLGDQLDAAAARMADAWGDFLGQKKDRDEAVTPADDKIRDEIDALRASTTRFNRRVNASFLRRATWRLRREGEEQQRAEVLERVREIDAIVQRLQHQLVSARPGEPVLAVWQELRPIIRRINALCRRP